MNKITLAVILIFIGVILLLKNSNLLPESYCRGYLDIFRHYWPVLIILFGFHFLAKEKFKALARVIIWLVLCLIGLWVMCQMMGQYHWVA